MQDIAYACMLHVLQRWGCAVTVCVSPQDLRRPAPIAYQGVLVVYRLHQASADLLDTPLREIIKRSTPPPHSGQLFRIYLSEPNAKKIQESDYASQMLQATSCTLCAIFNLTLSQTDYLLLKNQCSRVPMAARHDSRGNVTSMAAFVADHEPVDLESFGYDDIQCEISDIWMSDEYQRVLEELDGCVRAWPSGATGSGSSIRRHQDVMTCCRRTMASFSRAVLLRWPLFSYGQVLPPQRSVPSYLRMRELSRSLPDVAGSEYFVSFGEMVASSKIRTNQEAIENVGTLRSGLSMKDVSTAMALELILNEIALRSLEAIRHGPVHRSCNCRVQVKEERSGYYGCTKRKKIRGTKVVMHWNYDDMPDFGRAGTVKHSVMWICRLDTLKRFVNNNTNNSLVPNGCLYSIGVLRVVKSVQSCGKEYTLEPAIEELLSPDGVSYQRIGPQHVLFTLQLVDLHEAYFTYTGFLNVAPLACSGRCMRLLVIWYMCRISQTDISTLTKADALQ